MFNKLVFNNINLKKLSTSLVIAASLLVVQVPVANSAESAGKENAQKEVRKTQLPSPRVGKKVQKAFEKYGEDDIQGALDDLLDISLSKPYDTAYVAFMIAQLSLALGDNEPQAIKYFKQALEPDILNTSEQASALRYLADLQMQTEDYKGALTNYYAWLEFTGKTEGGVHSNIANAYYALKQLDKVIKPADLAIAAYGTKKPNQSPFIVKFRAFYELKQYKNAVKVLETVIQIFPENKQWWTQLPTFYMLIEDYDKAAQTLDLAHKLGHLTQESQIKTLASLYSQSDAPYRAARLLEKYVASGLVKRDDSNIASLANAWHSALHIDKAAKYYGELAKMTNKAVHYRKTGMLLKQDEQFAKAAVALKKAIELGVNNKGQIYMSIAESYFYLEKYKEAYAAIQKAVKDPKSRKYAKGWKQFIVDTAKRKKVTI